MTFIFPRNETEQKFQFLHELYEAALLDYLLIEYKMRTFRVLHSRLRIYNFLGRLCLRREKEPLGTPFEDISILILYIKPTCPVYRVFKISTKILNPVKTLKRRAVAKYPLESLHCCLLTNNKPV